MRRCSGWPLPSSFFLRWWQRPRWTLFVSNVRRPFRVRFERNDELPDWSTTLWPEFGSLSALRWNRFIRFFTGQRPKLALRHCFSSFFYQKVPTFDAIAQMKRYLADILKNRFLAALGLQDKAKYLATLFINWLIGGDYPRLDRIFEVSRYGERLAAAKSKLRQPLRQP